MTDAETSSAQLCEKKPSWITRLKWGLERQIHVLPRETLRWLLRQYAKRADSNMISHAQRELQVVGYDPHQTEEDPDKWIQENLLELLAVFSMQGHSGFSAPHCARMFKTLALFEPLGPLTGEDHEWVHVSDDCWQNNRCSHVFKGADGKAYDIEGKIFREPNGVCYQSSDSRVPVTFPYTPTREYVDVPFSDEESK